MNKSFIFLCSLLTVFNIAYSQSQDNYYNLEMQTGFTTKNHIPFWLRSNQYGSVPLDNASISMIGTVQKDYSNFQNKKIDLGVSFIGKINAGDKSNFTLIEGMGKVRYGIFQLSAGRSRDVVGLCDTLLTTGAWSISGTAVGIPKLEISVPEYYYIPWFDELFSIKGQFAHGWAGQITLKRPSGVRAILQPDTIKNKQYYHQKSFYGRIGKPDWKFKVYGGFNHQVFWGNEDVYYGELYTLSQFETFYRVVVGKAYHNNNIPTNSKIGNHLGSIDIGFEYNFEDYKVLLYRQNFYDVGNLYYLTNIRDGLNGLSITNLNKSENKFQIQKILFEFLYTKSQGGQAGAKSTPTPYEDYYNNFGQYVDGWSYNEVSLGTPFISSKYTIRSEHPIDANTYFGNNRLVAYHLGLTGELYEWNYTLKSSYSRNFGTYYTTDEEQTTDIENPGELGIFGKQNQFSAYIAGNRNLELGINVGFIFAFDIGTLLYNSAGLFLTASKSF